MIAYIGKGRETDALIKAFEKALRYEESRPHPDCDWMETANRLLNRIITCKEKQDDHD